MVIERNELSARAMGGTELMALGMSERLDLTNYQIVCSRVRDLDESKYRIFWAHDLPGDPESEFLRDPIKQDWFHHYVFVSNWQMWKYVETYGLQLEKCTVIPNAIVPIADHIKPTGPINLIYYSTPHRGLEILVPTFYDLFEKYKNIRLNVYSSFGLYGWEERDAPYKPIFDACDHHPAITRHGAVSNEKIREALKSAHILAYPSIWPETSCLVLIEAMSAGLKCVHSNLAALPETSGGLTDQYTFHGQKLAHQQKFHERLENAIVAYNGPCTYSSDHVRLVHDWETVIPQWQYVLDSQRGKSLRIPKHENIFTVKAP